MQKNHIFRCRKSGGTQTISFEWHHPARSSCCGIVFIVWATGPARDEMEDRLLVGLTAEAHGWDFNMQHLGLMPEVKLTRVNNASNSPSFGTICQLSLTDIFLRYSRGLRFSIFANIGCSFKNVYIWDKMYSFPFVHTRRLTYHQNKQNSVKYFPICTLVWCKCDDWNYSTVACIDYFILKTMITTYAISHPTRRLPPRPTAEKTSIRFSTK